MKREGREGGASEGINGKKREGREGGGLVKVLMVRRGKGEKEGG